MLEHNFSPYRIFPYNGRIQCEVFSVYVNHYYKTDIEYIGFFIKLFLISSKPLKHMRVRLDFLNLLWKYRMQNI